MKAHFLKLLMNKDHRSCTIHLTNASAIGSHVMNKLNAFISRFPCCGDKKLQCIHAKEESFRIPILNTVYEGHRLSRCR